MTKRGITTAQLDRISALMDDSFGFADEDGSVIYAVPEGLWEDGRISFSEEEEAADGFFKKDGFLFLKCFFLDGVYYLFKRADTDITCTERAIKLAAYAIELETRLEDPEDAFYKRLITGGPGAVTVAEIKEHEAGEQRGFVVLMVIAAVKGDVREAGIVSELLASVYPYKQGHRMADLGSGRFAVVSPVQNDEDVKSLIETAEMVKNTVTAELMLNVTVAMGFEVQSLSRLAESYESAMKAADIGETFELEDECFAYRRLGFYRLIFELSPENCLEYISETLGGDFFKDKNGPELLASLRAFLDNDMNVTEASKALYIHRNTLLYRMDKFRKMTGLDPSKFEDGFKIKLVLMIIKYLEKKAPDELLKYVAFYRKK